MPFNGVGVFTRVYQWVQDAANGIFVDATRTDTDSNDIAAGLTNCVTRDGQSPWLANIPANGFKITGLAAGVNTTDSTNYTQVFNNPAFNSPTIVTDPALTDNSSLIPSTRWVTQKAFQTALPAQTLGFLRSDGTNAAFTQTHTGYAQNEVKGADIASAATINLTTATGNLIHITGTTTITAITIPSGAEREVVFDGVLTLTYNATTLILPTAANIITAAGDTATIRGDGSGNARVVKYQRANGQPLANAQIGDHEVIVQTGNGRGSTNTAIRRFSTISVNVGTAITYADSATLGASFTINETGIYAIQYTDDFGTNVIMGISRNSTTNNAAMNGSTPAAERIAISGTYSGLGLPSNAVRVTKLTAGDVIRPNDGGSSSNTTTFAFFSIRKIGPAP